MLDDLHLADAATLSLLPWLSKRARVLAAVTVGHPGWRELLAQVGLESVLVQPLTAAHAQALLAQGQPQLPERERRSVQRAAAGNPYLLKRLARGPGDELLRLELIARVDAQPASVRETVAGLALIGRPARDGLLGEGLADALEAGLVVRRGEVVGLRHELVGEVAKEGLGGAELRRLHAELAQRLESPAETAWHHAGAGNRQAALRDAMRAVAATTKPGRRARLLALAADCSTGPQTEALRIRAARALLEAGSPDEAGALAGMVASQDAELLGQAAICVARVSWYGGDLDRAERCLAAAIERVDGTAMQAGVELRIELARLSTFARAGDDALELAGEAWRLAQESGVAQMEARLVLAHAHLVAFSEDAIAHYRAALEVGAPRDREALELEAAAGLIEALQAFGDAATAYGLVDGFIERAATLELSGWECQLKHLRAHLELFHRGDYSKAIAEAEALRGDRAGLGERVSRSEANLALALADVGRDRDARAVLDEANRHSSTPDIRAALLWARSEVDWLAGRPGQALAGTAECLALESPFRGLATATAGWAARDAGAPPPGALETVEYPVIAGAVAESQALAVLAGGGLDEAGALFEQAARQWAGRSVRSELRCLWAAGEATHRSGAMDRGRGLLLEAERRAYEHRMVVSAGAHTAFPESGGGAFLVPTRARRRWPDRPGRRRWRLDAT